MRHEVHPAVLQRPQPGADAPTPQHDIVVQVHAMEAKEAAPQCTEAQKLAGKGQRWPLPAAEAPQDAKTTTTQALCMKTPNLDEEM